MGNINKTLYKLGKKRPRHLLPRCDDRTALAGTSIPGFSAAPGFDEATGWGSPNAGALLPAIAKPGNG